MTTSTTKLIAALVALAVPSVAVAKNGGNGGGNHSLSSSFKSGLSNSFKNSVSSAARSNATQSNGVQQLSKTFKSNSGVALNAKPSLSTLDAIKIANAANGAKQNLNNVNKKDVAKGIGIVLATAIANNNLRNNGGNNGGNCNGNNNNNNNGNCNNNNNNNNGNCNNGGINDGDGGLNVENQNFPGQAFEPFHSSYVTLPGDSFYTVSLKEYGTSKNARYIAQFNNMPETTGLVPGMTLQLPSISVNGQLSVSKSPPAESLQNAVNQVGGTSTGTPATFASTTTPAVDTTPRPQVNVGSTLLVDGQTFGERQGTARLRVGGAAFKIEIVEWTNASVKIRLPELELDSNAKADIEVVKADGTLAAKTGIELTAANNVALAQ